MYQENSELQGKVLSGLASALGIIVLSVIYLNLFINKFYILAFVEILFFIASFYIAIVASKKKHKNWQVYLYLASLLIVISFALIKAPFLKGVFFWVFCLPVIFYILTGIKMGFVFSLLSISGAYAIFFQKTGTEDLFFMHQSGSVNFISCYLSIWVVSHLYENNRQKKEKTLYLLANTDIVTGAKNRLAFKNRCNELIEQKVNFFTILIDIDYFKKVNDEYGHDVGDDVLKSTVECITKTANSTDVFRYGGEEFCVLCTTYQSETECVDIAENIRLAIQNNHVISRGNEISITASLGVTAYNEGQGLEAMFNLVDQKMYEAKFQGRNQVISDYS